MGKYFGTDGIRGISNRDLTAGLALSAGRAAAQALMETVVHKPVFAIGKDTRASCDMLEAALAAGICSAGADVMNLGVIPTPAVAYLTKKYGADAGVVISASHNPFEYNGIKIFDGDGFKLSDEAEAHIEELIDNPRQAVSPTDIGVVRMMETAAHEDYEEFVASQSEGDLSGLSVLADCSNGAASVTAGEIFRRAGVKADIINSTPDGVNINRGCGSTHLDALREAVVAGGYDLGIAFDGDADRCLIVDERGGVVDGDSIMAICATREKRLGRLPKDTLVATVMSNLGFHSYCRKNGLNVVVTNVGDRYVMEAMKKGGYMLGGEQSGHIIFFGECSTGDGELTAIRFLDIVAESGRKVSELSAEIPVFPQILVNVEAPPSIKYKIAQLPEVEAEINRWKSEIGEDGRILVRASGTENLVRVMVEGKTDEMVGRVANSIAEMMKMLVEGR